jgi:predicted deacylase
MKPGFLLLFGFVTFGLVAANAAEIVVGTARAPQGQRATGFLEIAAGSDAAARVPVIVINGARPGPRLAITSGAHGTEYASIIAMEKLGRSIDPAELSGSVVIVPLMNLASFHQKVPHINPIDNKGMNRMYPGKADGTQTERISWAVGKQVIEPSDYLIDLHGGDLDENLRRYSYWPRTGKERLDAASRAMALAFGLDHIIIQNQTAPATPGAMSASRFALESGKPTVIAEAGHSGTVYAEDTDVLVDGCKNVMRHLKMLAGTVKAVENPVWLGTPITVRSEADGIFYPLVGPEAYVAQGMKVGYVTDYFGDQKWDVVSPLAGVVVYICAVPSMKKGDTVAFIAEVASGK